MKRTWSALLLLALFLVLAVPVRGAFKFDFVIDGTGVLTKYLGAGGDVEIPDVVAAIGESAFAGCETLTGVTIPESVSVIRSGAFSGCVNLTSVSLAAGLASIEAYAFSGCTALTDIAIPGSVTSIGAYAFSGCEGLEKITLAEGVRSIDLYAFENCRSLTGLTLPDSLRKLETAAFSGCGSLVSIRVSAGNVVYGDIDGVLFNKSLTELILYPQGRGGSYSIPEGVTSIGDGAFESCGDLTGVSIPDSIRSIGYWAFFGCSALEQVTLPDGVTAIGGFAFGYCSKLTSISIPAGVESVGSHAFSDCRKLTDVTIPDSVTSIGGGAFDDTPWQAAQGEFVVVNGTLLKYRGRSSEVTIPAGVTSIASAAFYSCSSLRSVTIPSDVTSIGDQAFSHCGNLTDVTMEEGVTSIGLWAFSDCGALAHVTIPSSVTNVGKEAFSGTPWMASCGDFCIINGVLLEYQGAGGSVVIPDGVTCIGDYAFSDCKSLKEIEIPASVTSIGYGAFLGCSSLTSVRLACSPLELGSSVFGGCSGLEEAVFPAAGRAAVPMKSDNSGASTNSGLFWDGECFVRVENIEGLLVVERYSSSFRLLSSRSLESDPFDLWGGFFIGENYNFVFTGRDNWTEDDDAPVITVTKYDKLWKKLGETSLTGANTVVPFAAGSLRCAECGGVLYVHTCHQMYRSEDGLNHQANMTFALRQSDLTITDAQYEVTNDYAYVSHSFDQYILATGERELVTLDLGDGYPRALFLQSYGNKAGSETFAGEKTGVELLSIPGAVGDNTTGVSAGGLGETENGIVAVWNYNGVGALSSGFVMGYASDDPYPVRNVYFSWTDKKDFSESGTRTVQITDFPADGLQSAGRPLLAPTGLDGGYILWEIFDMDPFTYGVDRNDPETLAWAKYDAKGNVGEVHTAPGALSDCPPVCVDGKIVWYVTEHSVPTFYTLDDGGLTAQTALWQAPEAVKVRTNGELVWWTDAEPFIDTNSRTMVPLRAVAEALGLTVSWDGEAREAVFTDGVRTLIFPIGSDEARTGDGGTVQMDTAAVIVGGRTYAPIRYLAEYFGCEVAWDGKTRTVLLTN